MEIELEKVDEVVNKYNGDDGMLIQILQDVQSEYRWLPKEAIQRVCRNLNIPVSRAYRERYPSRAWVPDEVVLGHQRKCSAYIDAGSRNINRWISNYRLGKSLGPQSTGVTDTTGPPLSVGLITGDGLAVIHSK